MSPHGEIRTHRARRRGPNPGLLLAGLLALLALAVVVAVRGGGVDDLQPAGLPDVPAPAYAVLDGREHRIVAARDAAGRRPVASIVKLMTAYLVQQAGAPGRLVTVPPGGRDPDESNIRLVPGESQRRDVLLRAMLIVSAGDAADALAVDVAGSREAFVARMNAAADDLGLDDTRYANPSGLDHPDAHSSARDSVELAYRLMQDATVRGTVARTRAMLHGEVFPATNRLLGAYPGADGVKTGHTDEAGWCIVASAFRDGRRMYVAVLGAASADDRDEAARRLLDWAFAAA